MSQTKRIITSGAHALNILILSRGFVYYFLDNSSLSETENALIAIVV